MDNNTHTGLFPALLEPAKEAAASLLASGDENWKAETRNGFWVARKERFTSEEGENLHEFELEGHTFVIFEPY